MLRIAFRVSASPRIGMGHVMRCLTLARLIVREAKADICFVCNRDLPDSVKRKLVDAGFRVGLAADSDAFDWRSDVERFAEIAENRIWDWVVTDHYGIDHQWENMARRFADRILVIDDLADRPHDCDALLDQNLVADMVSRYSGLVPDGCRLFLGPANALLREEFYAMKDRASERTTLHHVLVNFGGSDPTGETFKVLEALEQPGFDLSSIHVHVVAGPANPHLTELAQQCRSMPNVSFYPEVNGMAKFLADMDLAIGAGGVSLWERSFMGVPSMVIAVADNQIPSAEEAARQDMIWYMGESGEVTPAAIGRLLRNLAENPAELGRKSKQSLFMMHTLRKFAKHPVVSFMLETARTERSL